jgi:hypothetical protein
MTNHELEIAKLVVSIVGLGGTIGAAVVAIRTFRRNEKWKRAEFLAREMKEFFDDSRVQTALLLIDWGSRQMALLDENADDHGRVRVTRILQVHALLPHILVNERAGSDLEPGEQTGDPIMRRFTPAEAAIRDCYDAFLDGLERFSSYLQTGLVDTEELRPYLDYWIDDIHAPAKDNDDAAWSAALLTYIDFYRFRGVQSLFRAFDRNIDPTGESFRGFLAQMTDRALALQLANVVNRQGVGPSCVVAG